MTDLPEKIRADDEDADFEGHKIKRPGEDRREQRRDGRRRRRLRGSQIKGPEKAYDTSEKAYAG